MTFPRQPDQIVITPSNQSPWHGWGERRGDRFTRPQVAEMRKRGIDPENPPRVVTVFREATTREMYWPMRAAPPVYQFDCPVLREQRDGRLRIIAPNGDEKLVLANGWVRRPSYLNRHLVDGKGAQAADMEEK